jgi:hypothetical protein
MVSSTSLIERCRGRWFRRRNGAYVSKGGLIGIFRGRCGIGGIIGRCRGNAPADDSRRESVITGDKKFPCE